MPDRTGSPQAPSRRVLAPNESDFGGLTYATVLIAGTALAALLLKDSLVPWAAPFAALWWIAVVVVVRSDLEHFIIPDGASLVIATLGLTYAAVSSWQMGFGPTRILADLSAAALGGGGGFAMFWLVARLYRRFRKREGLGFGDVKLAGALATWLSPLDAALALQTAAIAGLLVLLWRRRREPLGEGALPFGAFMAPAAWLVFVAGPLLHHLMDAAE